MQSDLLMGLDTGRYLLETRGKPTSYLYMCILSTDVRFKHFKYGISNFTQINLDCDLLSLNRSKKLIYKYEDNRDLSNNNIQAMKELKTLRNDFNIRNLEISNEHFSFLLNVLIQSTEQLSETLKRSNDFSIALI